MLESSEKRSNTTVPRFMEICLTSLFLSLFCLGLFFLLFIVGAPHFIIVLGAGQISTGPNALLWVVQFEDSILFFDIWFVFTLVHDINWLLVSLICCAFLTDRVARISQHGCLG